MHPQNICSCILRSVRLTNTITMKKYLAVWGALFFCVICLSLYLMLETLNTSPARYSEIDAVSSLHYRNRLKPYWF